MPLYGVGQHDPPDGLPAGGAQRPAGFAERARHRLQRFARRDDDHRQRHHREREAGRQDAGAETEEQHERADAEQRVHDRRDAGEVDDRQVDETREPVVARVLGEIEGRRDPDRHRHDQRHRHQPDGAHQGGEDAARGHAVARLGEQEVDRERRSAAPDQDPEHGGYGHDQEQSGEQEESLDPALAAEVALGERSGLEHGVDCRQVSSSRGCGAQSRDWRRGPRTMRSASRLMTKVTANSRMPSVNRAR